MVTTESADGCSPATRDDTLRHYRVGGLVMAAVAAGALFLLPFLGSDADSDGSDVATVFADYPQYDDASDLAADSQLVVVGVIQDVEPVEVIVDEGAPSEEERVAAGKGAGGSMAFTDTVYRIQQVLAGEIRPGTSLTVRELGGETDEFAYVVNGQRVPERGQRHLLFLAEHEPGVYVIVGGEQGRYQIERGKVTSADLEEPLKVHEALEGLGLEAIEEEVADEVASFPDAVDGIDDDSEGPGLEPPVPGENPDPEEKP